MSAGGNIRISDGDAYCTLSPERGGCLGEWNVAGQDMLRRTDQSAIESDDARDFASFPLVPYSNRIGYGRFDWDGETRQIRPNFPPEPHAVHGVGWRRPWRIAQHDARSCEMVLDYECDANWHWSFSASQHIALFGNSLHLTLSATNKSAETVPLAFGHHPYFDSAGAILHFNASQVWQTGEHGLPDRNETPTGRFDFSNGDPVEGRALDNGYAGWDGKAHISWNDRPLKLDIVADMSAAVVFVPDNESYFCFEPVPHIINALNLPDHAPQMPVIRPGEAYSATIIFTATPS
jgi:aldose 1-epimerase